MISTPTKKNLHETLGVDRCEQVYDMIVRGYISMN